MKYRVHVGTYMLTQKCEQLLQRVETLTVHLVIIHETPCIQSVGKHVIVHRHTRILIFNIAQPYRRSRVLVCPHPFAEKR